MAGGDIIGDYLDDPESVSGAPGGTLDEAVGIDDEPVSEFTIEDYMKPGVRLPPELEKELTPEQRRTYYEKIRREDETYGQTWNAQGPTTATGELWTDEAYSTLEGDEIWEIQDVTGAGQPERPRYTSQYSSSYARDRLNSMSAAELAALEIQMYNAGYLQNEPTIAGGRSIEIINAFTQLVKEADAGRNDWETQLERDVVIYQQRLLDAEGDKPKRPGFSVPDFRKPDYATLAQVAKESVRGQLGRNPSESEMTLLTDYLGSQYRNKWQQNEVDTARSTWEKNGRAVETGQEQGAVTIPQVDPISRFNEFFDQRYEGELAHRKRVDQTKQRSQNLFGSFDMIARSI